MPYNRENEDHSMAPLSSAVATSLPTLSQAQAPQPSQIEFKFHLPTPTATPERARSPTNSRLESKNEESKSENTSSESKTTKSENPSIGSSTSSTTTTTETRKPIFDLVGLGLSIPCDQLCLLTPPSSRSQSPELSSTIPNQKEKTSNSNNNYNISSQSVHADSDQVTPSPTSQKFQSAQSSASIGPTPTLDAFNNLFPGLSPLQRVQDHPGCCIANTQRGKGRRCTNPIKWLDGHEIETLLKDLPTAHEYGTQKFNTEVLGVANRLVCRRWHQIGGQKPDKPRNNSTIIIDNNRAAAVVVETTLTIPINIVPYNLRSGRATTTYTDNNPHKIHPLATCQHT